MFEERFNNLIPAKCCDPGEYICQIPMAIKGKCQGIDLCISDIVAALNAANIITIASCCGHGKQNGSIVLEDGREILITNFSKSNNLTDIEYLKGRG